MRFSWDVFLNLWDFHGIFIVVLFYLVSMGFCVFFRDFNGIVPAKLVSGHPLPSFHTLQEITNSELVNVKTSNLYCKRFKDEFLPVQLVDG